MEIIRSNLLNLGYNFAVSEKDFGEGTPNLTFVDVITWLNSEVVSLCKLGNYVNTVSNKEGTFGFFVEVSSLLTKLCCPYKSLVKGQITERLNKAKNKKLLVLYFCTELESAKIQAFKKSKEKEVPWEIELNESKTARELRAMLICLRLLIPTDTITPQILFCNVEKKLRQLSHPLTPREKIGELLFTGVLMERQWLQLEYLYKEMYQEYKTRRGLLMARLDVTVRSFIWGNKLNMRSEEIMNIYNKFKADITLNPFVNLFHVLAAKSDLAVIEKTSSASVRKNTKSSVNSVVIGDVPDRGGRPEEQPPPPPEISKWQKNDLSCRGSAVQSCLHNTGSFYSRRNRDYSRDNISYRENSSNSKDNIGDSRENPRYSRDNYGYSRSITSYKSSGYSWDENSKPHSSTDNYRGNNSSRNSYKGSYNKSNYNSQHIHQPVTYCPQIGNQQFEFGGYLPAGSNFQHYGTTEGIIRMNLINRSKGGSRGSRIRDRRVYDTGSDQSRGGQDEMRGGSRC